MKQEVTEQNIDALAYLEASTASLGDAVEALAESVMQHQAALNELQETMIARGLVKRESIARARAEMEMEATHA